MSERNGSVASASGSSTSNAMSKIALCLQEGRFYEAQQLYRTIYHRHMAKRNYTEAVNIALQGAQVLLQKGQFSSGTDLALLLIEAYSTASVPVSVDTLDSIVQLFTLYPSEQHALRDSFTKAALKWSSKLGPHKRGDPALHHVIGLALAKERKFDEAQSHFFLGTTTSAAALASMLMVWSSEGYKSEKDLFFFRAIFQYLIMKNLQNAIILVEELFKLNATVDSDFILKRLGPLDAGNSSDHADLPKQVTVYACKLPLLNLAQFVVLAIRRNNVEVFTALKDKYRDQLNRDDSFPKMMEQVGEIYFQLRAPTPSTSSGGFSNLFNDLLRGFMGGGSSSRNGGANDVSMADAELD